MAFIVKAFDPKGRLPTIEEDGWLTRIGAEMRADYLKGIGYDVEIEEEP